jgi:L-lactate dehydrogenase complex protein LldE
MARVALFVPCYVSLARPADAAAARTVLERLGDEVTTLAGLCCGQPAFNAGARREARQVAAEAVRSVRGFDAVVIPSGSCAAMAAHEWRTLFPNSPVAGERASRVREFTAYVAAHPNAERLSFRLRGVVAYHDSCHARRELGLTETVLGLLARVEGLEVRRLRYEAECCGFGGTFCVKLPEVAAALASAKAADAAASGARVLVSTDLSCLLHVESAARGLGMELEGWTVAELLARSLS